MERKELAMRTLGPQLAAGLLAVGVLIGGCGGSPEPSPLPKPSKSSSPSASATPTPPVMPEAAKAKTKAGAIAFARHYVDLINHAQATGDASALLAVEDTTCGSCERGRKYVDRVYGGGGTIQGGALVIDTALAFRNPATSGWTVTLGVRFGPQRIDWPEPKSDEQLKGGRLPLNVQLVFHNSQWKVAEWTRGA
jgi:hypothetical protein